MKCPQDRHMLSLFTKEKRMKFLYRCSTYLCSWNNNLIAQLGLNYCLTMRKGRWNMNKENIEMLVYPDITYIFNLRSRAGVSSHKHNHAEYIVYDSQIIRKRMRCVRWIVKHRIILRNYCAGWEQRPYKDVVSEIGLLSLPSPIVELDHLTAILCIHPRPE